MQEHNYQECVIHSIPYPPMVTKIGIGSILTKLEFCIADPRDTKAVFWKPYTPLTIGLSICITCTVE